MTVTEIFRQINFGKFKTCWKLEHVFSSHLQIPKYSINIIVMLWLARNETSNHVLKADIKDKDFCKFVPVTTCTCIMYKILFLVFFFSLSNSEKTGDCPTDYLDGKYYYCYHIGTKAMTLSEARRYCESKNDGILAIPAFLTDYMQNELVKIARSNLRGHARVNSRMCSRTA